MISEILCFGSVKVFRTNNLPFIWNNGHLQLCSNRKFASRSCRGFIADSLIRRRKKNTVQPRRGSTWVFRLLVVRSNHWATKPRQELRANFSFFLSSCQFFFFSLQGDLDVWAPKHAETNDNSLDLIKSVQIEIRSYRDHSIKSNSFLFFSNKGVNWQLDQMKKPHGSPGGDQTWVFRLPVGRSNHWAMKPRQDLLANFRFEQSCKCPLFQIKGRLLVLKTLTLPK